MFLDALSKTHQGAMTDSFVPSTKLRIISRERTREKAVLFLSAILRECTKSFVALFSTVAITNMFVLLFESYGVFLPSFRR